MNIKDELNTRIGFLQWAEVDAQNVQEINSDIDRLFISPDVHSLHLVYGLKPSTNEWYHEIKDWPEERRSLIPLAARIKTWLIDEVGFDWWETGVGYVADQLDTNDEVSPFIILWEDV